MNEHGVIFSIFSQICNQLEEFPLIWRCRICKQTQTTALHAFYPLDSLSKKTNFWQSFFAILTLYVKMSSRFDSITQSIVRKTPIFSRITSVGLKTQGVPFSHSFPIFQPRHLRSWVSSGSTVKGCVRSFDNSLVSWSWSKAWWNWNKWDLIAFHRAHFYCML